jgi:hypothetical protein
MRAAGVGPNEREGDFAVRALLQAKLSVAAQQMARQPVCGEGFNPNEENERGLGFRCSVPAPVEQEHAESAMQHTSADVGNNVAFLPRGGGGG